MAVEVLDSSVCMGGGEGVTPDRLMTLKMRLLSRLGYDVITVTREHFRIGSAAELIQQHVRRKNERNNTAS